MRNQRQLGYFLGCVDIPFDELKARTPDKSYFPLKRKAKADGNTAGTLSSSVGGARTSQSMVQGTLGLKAFLVDRR